MALMEVVAEKLIEIGGEKAVEVFKRLMGSNSRRMDEQWNETLMELLFEIQRDVRELQAVGKSVTTLDEREACALLRRIGSEATQATTQDRVRLLAQAFAGLLSPDLDSEMRSRVSRAVVQLETSDVVALRRALAIEPSKGSDKLGGSLIMSIPVDRAYEGLILAGCVADANVIGGGVYVTILGQAVAKCLEQWRPEAEQK